MCIVYLYLLPFELLRYSLSSARECKHINDGARDVQGSVLPLVYEIEKVQLGKEGSTCKSSGE
jgi:hypothetical protein